MFRRQAFFGSVDLGERYDSQGGSQEGHTLITIVTLDYDVAAISARYVPIFQAPY